MKDEFVQGALRKKPMTKEDEYFLKLDKERIEDDKREKEEEERLKERKKLRELHYMRCPKCGMELEEIEHESVLIDKCNECNGIWLDEGELETILSKGEGFFGKLFKRILK